MLELYHATKTGSVNPILKEGIKPNSAGYAYLSQTIENALLAISGREWKEITVLRVKVSAGALVSVKPNKDGSLLYRGWIHPSLIHIVSI